VGPGGPSGYEPPPAANQAYYWQPAQDNGVRLQPPVRSSQEPPRTMPRVTEQPDGKEDRKDDDQSSVFPSGIAQFAVAMDNVTAGLKPSLDGFDWLKEKGYRTVLYVHKPGADDAGDRKQAVKRGLKFVSLEVSPADLSKKVVREFSRIIQDNKGHPLFVYDKDGALAGGLWYLYFRTVLDDSDEAARLKAERLGFKEEGDGDHKAMWLAVQKYLAQK
jgi:hypothetical protein